MANPTYPEQPGSKRFLKPAKPIFYNSWFNPPPLGCLPIQVEGGGRYDSDPVTPGWQEDSFWVGGYYGPKMEIDEAKVAKAFRDHPPGYHYCHNVEHWKWDRRRATDAEVEDTIRRFRHFFLTAQKVRPDMRWGLYDICPIGDYWTPAHYQTGLDAWEKWQRGEPLVDFPDRWALGGVADRVPDVNGKETYVWNPNKEWSKAFTDWQKASDRLTVGFQGKTKMWDWGVVDLYDYMAPSLYDFYVGDDSEAYTKWSISEARRVGGWRPVYPFIWPVYHDGAPVKAGETIPLDEWRLHCRRVLKYADGAIIWGATMPDHAEHVRIAQDEAERAVSGRPI